MATKKEVVSETETTATEKVTLQEKASTDETAATKKPVTKTSTKTPAKTPAKTAVKKTPASSPNGEAPTTIPAPTNPTIVEEGEKDSQEKNETKGTQEGEEKSEPRPERKKPVAIFAAEQVLAEDSDLSRDLYSQSRFGAVLDDGKLQLSLIEALYLFEKGRLTIKDLRGRPYDGPSYIRKAKKIEPNFWIRYCVFKDMRNRGYIVKTALKFGADFRVYDRGIKPGEDHARWVLYPIHEGTTLTWHEFSAKVRVAHSTKKRLLIGIVDDEADVTYYEIKWMRP